VIGPIHFLTRCPCGSIRYVRDAGDAEADRDPSLGVERGRIGDRIFVDELAHRVDVVVEGNPTKATPRPL
jgi:hypothetical protein